MENLSLFIASLGFLLLHFVSATNLRAAMVNKYGLGAWMGIFSLFSLGFFSWMTLEYLQANRFEDLWVMPDYWLWMNAALMFVAFAFIVLGNIPDKDAKLGKGIFAITRHPSNWGVAIFALAHMVSNGSIEAQMFWGSLFGSAVVGSYFLDNRKIREGSVRWQNSAENSSWLPFLAIAQGRTRLTHADFKLVPVIGAVSFWFLAMIVHVGFFGTYILPL
ncbi:MAG: hypothetical protein HRU29_06210 [Rhizobiales bacterium]|nr:hypothetical protein [Hyphomicrobiales bacterium]NRB13979.1 hypothetical protein [Hyphomicrobiales bacterium]